MWAVYWAKWRNPAISISTLNVNNSEFQLLCYKYDFIQVDELVAYFEPVILKEFRRAAKCFFQFMLKSDTKENLLEGLCVTKCFLKSICALMK
jgi:hypothetical protein